MDEDSWLVISENWNKLAQRDAAGGKESGFNLCVGQRVWLVRNTRYYRMQSVWQMLPLIHQAWSTKTKFVSLRDLDLACKPEGVH